MEKEKGIVLLIPTFLGEAEYQSVMPERIRTEIERLRFFAVENEKTARRYIKKVVPAAIIDELTFFPIGKHSTEEDILHCIEPCMKGHDVGIISEAGVPAVADPGAAVVALAHTKNIRVVPLSGPSSILMGLMASGLSGQNFAFNGYLPIGKAERRARLRELESIALRGASAQIFIETPFRNVQMFSDVIEALSPRTMLCIACDISTQNEYIRTMSIGEWKKMGVPDINKRPSIFIIQ